MANPLTGKGLGKYEIVELTGQGAMAEVYRAFQPTLERLVAVKIMHSFLVEDRGFSKHHVSTKLTTSPSGMRRWR